MKRKDMPVTKRPKAKLIDNSWDNLDSGVVHSSDDSALFARISRCMKSKAVNEKENILVGEIREMQDEISQKNLDETSSEWVREWNETEGSEKGADEKRAEIRDFITGAFEQKEKVGKIDTGIVRYQGFKKALVILTPILAAAALTGVFFLFRPLLFPDDSRKLFSEFYEPFAVVSTATRSNNTIRSENFSNAIENYKKGDYLAAAAGFEKETQNNPASLSSSFFMGIADLETGNTARAIEMLNIVEKGNGEFSKEATWYLGLAYLKSGDKEKAADRFGLLAGSPGFYSDRAEKILRRLK
jgi:TolA-binding protein